jgi:hypothetical protein
MMHGSNTFVYAALAVPSATTDTPYTTSAWALASPDNSHAPIAGVDLMREHVEKRHCERAPQA